MANINSLTSNSYSSSSSIYGSRNVLTGLASGMDTETMIENSVTGYQTKIKELQQSQEKLTWKQDAYRELIDQMYSITNKYTSYTSTTNLSSNSFFTSNVTTTANGKNASAVTATGKATSDIQINAVTQLATATRYAVDASSLSFNATEKAEGTAIDWGKSVTKGTLTGTMTLKLGKDSIDIRFTDDDKYASTSELLSGINKKLQAQDADVAAVMSGSEIKFVVTGDAARNGDSVYISGASSSLKGKLNVETASSSADENRFEYTSFSLSVAESELTKTLNMAQNLSGKTIDVTLDGTTKTIKIGDLSGIEQPDSNTAMTAALKDDLQASIDKEFGANRITVGVTDAGGLKFDVPKGSGSTLKVTSSAGGELGIGEAGVSNYFNTGKKLDALLGTDWLNANARAEGTVDADVAERYFDADGNELKKEGGSYYRLGGNGAVLVKDGEKVKGSVTNVLRTDTEGNLVKRDASDGKYYHVTKKGEWSYHMEINGETIDGFTKDSSLESVLNKISSNAAAGVRVSYSNLTNQFVFTANETGAGSKVEFDDALAKRLFGDGTATLSASDSLGYTRGQDAVIKATVNGKELELARSSNVVNMDGLTVTLKDTFSAYDENNKVNKSDVITFTTSSDADKVVDTIKSFVEDVNKLMTSVHDAFTTQPITKTSSSSKSGTTYYEPLTEDDKNDMSESAVAKYEEKAKTGLLFGDSDLRALYDKLLNTVQSYGADRVDMEAIGLSTTYSGGVTTFSLNEEKLRAALDSDPDKVRNVFTKTKDGGSATDGLMSSLRSTLNAYASTSLGSPGILVSKAGTRLSAVSLLNNNLYKQISNIDSQIESWQTKLSNKIDYYTKQFTALEKLMSTMNNQSSMLADLMGY